MNNGFIYNGALSSRCSVTLSSEELFINIVIKY